MRCALLTLHASRLVLALAALCVALALCAALALAAHSADAADWLARHGALMGAGALYLCAVLVCAVCGLCQ